ncbi:MAG: hypothetical protein U9R74_18515 [Pseudomonadota bacterium]|nr:hypothetical protein [Pseudomonadota bacterium]
MTNEAFRIPKNRRPVTIWIHPEGRVVGSMFVLPQSTHSVGEEKPIEVLNHPDPFLVIALDESGEIRFYNKRSIVRVIYPEESSEEGGELVQLACSLNMMDGSRLTGKIQEFLPPENARLFDYINSSSGGGSFVKIHLEGGDVCLVNTAYIVQVAPG